MACSQVLVTAQCINCDNTTAKQDLDGKKVSQLKWNLQLQCINALHKPAVVLLLLVLVRGEPTMFRTVVSVGTRT